MLWVQILTNLHWYGNGEEFWCSYSDGSIVYRTARWRPSQRRYLSSQ